MQPLPDLSKWEYGGPASLLGKPATHIWQLSERQLDKVNKYIMHVAQVR